nr:transmembrane protein 183 isoform X1 [Leptinotarsa decemlineata]
MSYKKSRKNRSTKNLGDITLNDCANSSVSKSRLKKSTNSVVKVLKNLEVEKEWDEKTDEFDGDFVKVEDEDGNVSYEIRQSDSHRRKKTVSNSEDLNSDGNEYHIDIWFLISEYIRPEDVGRFAGICRASFEVVCTAKFWFSLYRKHYQSVPNMPEQLQPECLVRKYSLRTSVVRALYHMYPPFIDKLKPVCTSFEDHPDVLRKRQCESLWYQKQKGQWIFYFKMRERTQSSLQHSTRGTDRRPDLLEILDDVSANPDEHCRVLQVTCLHSVRIPPVIGQLLTYVALTLSQGYRHHRLQLGFSSGVRSYYSPDGSDHTIIVLDPVIDYKLLDWWHPLYPHSHNMQDLLNQD